MITQNNHITNIDNKNIDNKNIDNKNINIKEITNIATINDYKTKNIISQEIYEALEENVKLRILVTQQKLALQIESKNSLAAQLGETLINGVSSASSFFSLPVKLLRMWRALAHTEPPAALGGKSFQKVFDAYNQGKIEAVKKLLDSASISQVMRANAYTILARQLMLKDSEQAAALARLAWEADPRPYRLKWLAFRLYDAKDYITAEAILDMLPTDITMSQSEKQHAEHIRQKSKQKRIEQVCKITKNINFFYKTNNILNKNSLNLNLDTIIRHNKIDVSIIIPVFNVENFLDLCINSLLNQHDKNLEFIFINDNSTDNSLKILQKYKNIDKRIIIIDNKMNIGVAASRNLGISIAAGQYIGFVDPDDYISENYFGTLYKLARSSNADIVMTNNVIRFPSTENKHKNMGFNINKKIDDNVKINILKTTGVTWNKIYNKNFLKKFNILFPEIKTMGTDNYFTILSLFFAKKIITTNYSIYYYRINQNSIINRKKDKSYFLLTEVYNRSLLRILYSNEDNIKKKIYIDAISERTIKDSISNLNKFENNFEKIEYINSIYNIFPNARFEYMNEEAVVSLTSYPARISTVHQTIISILNQDILPQKIILYLADSQFKNKEKDLPPRLLELTNNIFKIHWCEDIRSYKKLIPALKDYPDKIIITADDDVIYPINWLRILLTEHYRNPNDVQCMRARKIIFNNKCFCPYNEYRLIKQSEPSSFFILQTGLGGCLYKKDMFYKDISKKDLFTSLCPDGDDIWFWAMSVLNGTKIHWCNPGLNFPNHIEGTQDNGTSLWSQNKLGKNDKYLKNIINNYPQLINILKYK